MQGAAPSSLEMLLPFGLMFVIFYFLIIRPQGKKLKDHEKFVSDLKRGDAVITNSGILGTIDGMAEQVVNLEISGGVKIKILKKQIAGLQSAMLKTASENKS